MSLSRLIAALASLALSAPLLSADRSGPPDTILINGKIFPRDTSHPYIQALAIRGDRIIATGTTEAMQALSGPQTRLINLDGHSVIPGINDAHQHLSITPPGRTAFQKRRPTVATNPLWPERPVRRARQIQVVNPGFRDSY